MKKGKIVLFLAFSLITVFIMFSVKADATVNQTINISALQDKIISLEQRVSIIEDNLFENCLGSSCMGAEFLDSDGCPIYFNLTDKTKDKIRVLERQDCRTGIEINRINGNLNNIQPTNLTNMTQRISALENWKETITTTISNIWQLLTGHTTKIDNHEIRITNVENSGGGGGGGGTINKTLPNYFKYLSSGDRKTMVCGYGQENHLTSINDLGWNCTITYKVNQYTKKETATCKCKEIK